MKVNGRLGAGNPASKGQAHKPAHGFARDARKAGPSFVVFEDMHPAQDDIARERAECHTELTEELERCHSLLQLVAAEEEEQVGEYFQRVFNRVRDLH